MRIRFLSKQIYENGGPGKGPLFPAGYVLDAAGVKDALGLADDPSADWALGFLHRWLQRGVAVIDDGATIDPPAVVDTVVEQVVKTDLASLTRAQLDDLAEKRGVDISEARNKGDVIAALELAEELGTDV